MKSWLKVFFLFFILGSLVYFNSLNNKFLIDDFFFLHNPVLSTMKFIPSQWNPYREQALGVLDNHESLEYYRPTTHIVYDLCYAMFKYNYWAYHLLNIILFVFASSLIYLLIKKLTGNLNLAFLTGLFYLIHPINGIIVNYVSANVFAFQVIFTLCTILLLLKSLERKNDRVLYVLSLLFSFLSLFWHESGIMTPIYISAVILLFMKDPLRKKALYLFPYFLIIFSYVLFRFFFLSLDKNILKEISHIHMTVWECWASLFRVYMWYISQLIVPRGIVIAWATPILRDHVFWFALGACSLFMAFPLLYFRFAKIKILQLAIVWIVIGFSPVYMAALRSAVSGVQIEPHWFVVSSIGFFILAAYFCLTVLERTKKTGVVLLFILICGWGAVSHANNQLWADQKTYALYWAEHAPYVKSGYFYLADAYYRDGSFNESRKYYRMALAGAPSDLEIYNNLGIMDAKDGNWKGAELNYRKTLRIHPFSASTYCNLGDLYYKQGQWDKAKEYFTRSFMLNPLLIEPRRGLAIILLKQFKYQKAIDLCLKNLEIVNNDPDTLLLLIDIAISEKDIVSLRKYAKRIIKDVNDPKVLTKVGVDMAKHNEPIIALDCFMKAIRVAPDHNDAYLAAGTLFANLGKYDEAINICNIGSSIDPSDRRFQKYITIIKDMKLKHPVS